MKPTISIKEVSKTYKEFHIKAVDHVSLDLYKGTITCIVGENGAGKSTLMNLLFGLQKPDSGTISVEGKPTSFSSPTDAMKSGIGMVHQHFMLFDPMSVAKNVVMGIEPRKHHFFFHTKETNKRVQECLDANGFTIQANEKVGNLTVGDKQTVEITKMLYRQSEILILDEPTSMLTEQEIESLFITLKKLKDAHKCIIIILHKVSEVMKIADTIAVMRKGKLIGTYLKEEMTAQKLSDLMVGDSGNYPLKSQDLRQRQHNKVILSAKNLTVERNNRGKPLLHRVSFEVHEGEIMGFCGVKGNGMGVLEAVLGGMIPTCEGTITHNGVDITNIGSRRLRNQGLAFVPSDRIHYGSAEQATVEENIIINEREKYFPLSKNEKRSFIHSFIGSTKIKANVHQTMGSLSGGNMQKVIVAREIHNMSDYIVLSNPTWGLDVSSSSHVHQQIKKLQAEGKAIILISSNLDEIMELSDKINIMHNATIAAEFEMTPSITKKIIGSYMLGLGEKNSENT